MALTDLWTKSKKELFEKKINQIISIAGDGKLRDENQTSVEFRNFLKLVPSELLKKYVTECLSNTFNESGYVLQDLVNEIGRRLDFDVTSGRYRGVTNKIGFDGLWKLKNGYSIIVEVKTTDAYRIDLETIANYKNELIYKSEIREGLSSILIIVGREDTGELEAQIRGSRFAWDMRLISADSIIRLLDVKEDVEDPSTIKRIHEILIPREFTKLDEIVEILFSTTEEVKRDTMIEVSDNLVEKKQKFIPVSFHDSCVERVQSYLKIPLVKKTKATFISPDAETLVLCIVSREQEKNNQSFYWFAFHPHQRESLKTAKNSFISFGCGSSKNVLLIPFPEYDKWVDGFNITELESRYYWHVHIFKDGNTFILRRKKGFEKIDLTKYLL